MEDCDPCPTQAEVAKRLGVSAKHLNQVIKGHKGITQSLAAKLEIVTGFPAEFWLVHQAKYEARLAQVDVPEQIVDELKELLPSACVTRLRDAGIVSVGWAKDSGRALVRELYSLMKVCNPSLIAQQFGAPVAAAFRQSQAHPVKLGALWTWMELVKRTAENQYPDVPNYSEQRLRETIPALRKISRHDPDSFVESVTHLLNEAGVIFVAERDVSGARISGASFECIDKPVIAVSDRYKREDIFWFTLFHELAHVLVGDHVEGTIDVDLGSSDAESEQKADAWASQTLLPEAEFEMLRSNLTQANLVLCAERVGVSPGIVVGRLQHLGVIRLDQWNSLRRSFEIPA